MMGVKARAATARHTVSLEDLVPADDFYRHVDRVLDLSFVRDLVRDAYAPAGRPSIDPVVFFRLQLILFEGLRSERQLLRVAADREAYKLALVENLHREDLSRADKVAALDQLAELADAVGLNQSARELSMSPGWLSQRLAIRRNPRLFPALERGTISFGVADALQRAPAAAQQTLLDRVLAAPAPTPVAVARAWVEEARATHRAAGSAAAEDLARGGAMAEAAAGGRRAEPLPAAGSGANPYAALAARLRGLGAPTTVADRAGLAELAAAVAALRAGVSDADAPAPGAV